MHFCSRPLLSLESNSDGLWHKLAGSQSDRARGKAIRIAYRECCTIWLTSHASKDSQLVTWNALFDWFERPAEYSVFCVAIGVQVGGSVGRLTGGFNWVVA